ncbi:MAG TPA: acyltransferase [Rhodocyclaceae bacterium]|nr:acyltransferase [Rhodocyclaceae bacterium]
MSTNSSARHRFSFLDGMRGIAALFVVMRHAEEFWGERFFRSYLAVDLFFVLSGFVIASAYDEKIRTGAMSLWAFVKVRLIRLYPVYLLSIVVSAAVLFMLGSPKLVNRADVVPLALLTALFVPARLPGAMALFSLNGVYWSLFYELIANFIYAATRPWLSNVVLHTCVLLLGLILSVGASVNGGIDMGVACSITSIAAGCIRGGFGVFMGLLLYRHRDLALGRLTQRISPWVALLLMTLVLVSPSAGRFNVPVDLLVVTILFPLCVLVASHGVANRMGGLLYTLGVASYPIYVLHVPLGLLLPIEFADTALGGAPTSGIVLMTVLVLLAVWIEKYCDLPVRRWLTGKAFKQPT